MTLETATVKKKRRNLSWDCSPFPWELLLCWASHPRPLSELCCHNPASSWPWLLLSWTLTWPSLGSPGSHSTWSGPLAGCSTIPRSACLAQMAAVGQGWEHCPACSAAPTPGAVTQGCPSALEPPGLTPSTPRPKSPAHLQLWCCPSTPTPTPPQAASDAQPHSGLAVVSGGTWQEVLAGFPLQQHLVITNKIISKRLSLQIGKLIQKRWEANLGVLKFKCLTRSQHVRDEQEDRGFNIPTGKEPDSPSFPTEMESQNVKDDLKII